MASASKTIYFLSPYPFGSAPSQRFRYEQYIDLFKKEGYEIVIASFLDDAGWQVLYQDGKYFAKMKTMLRCFFKRLVLLFQLKKADYIFIHRELAQFGPPIFEWILAKILKKKFVYDFDDAIWLPNYSEVNARFQKVKCYWKVKHIIKWADVVTVGNAYLAEYALQFNANVRVIPTTIDTVNHHNQLIEYADKEVVNIGWTGTHTTMHYLNEVIPALEKLEKKYAFTFTVISNMKADFELKSMRFVKWSKANEIKDLASFDIGIMPLKDDQWSKGKCGFKALQYMSLGMPCVISPVGVNASIVQDGVNGFLYSTEEDLTRVLANLIEDATLRRRIGTAARATIEGKFSVNANFKTYLALFQ